MPKDDEEGILGVDQLAGDAIDAVNTEMQKLKQQAQEDGTYDDSDEEL